MKDWISKAMALGLLALAGLSACGGNDNGSLFIIPPTRTPAATSTATRAPTGTPAATPTASPIATASPTAVPTATATAGGSTAAHGALFVSDEGNFRDAKQCWCPDRFSV